MESSAIDDYLLRHEVLFDVAQGGPSGRNQNPYRKVGSMIAQSCKRRDSYLRPVPSQSGKLWIVIHDHCVLKISRSISANMDNTSESNQPNEVSEPAEQEPTPVSIVNPPLDAFIRGLVILANAGIETAVTLAVGGFLISGFLVSGKRYFEYFASDAALASIEGEAKEEMRKFLLSFETLYEPAPEGEQRPLPVFLHLRDARYFHNSGNALPSDRGIWWRGRISDVHGITLGAMSGQ